MKIIFLLFSIPFIITSCTLHVDEEEEISKATKVEGRVYDINNNKGIYNYKVLLQRFWITGDWSGYTTYHSENIDSTYTDENGNYSFYFDFLNKKEYRLLTVDNEFQYMNDLPVFYEIEQGIINTINIEKWLPIVLKLDLHVTNNIDPYIRISSYVNPQYSYVSLKFKNATISESEVDTLVYLETKPKSLSYISFVYWSGDHSEIKHQLKYSFNTLKQDTIHLSYDIDCALF